MDIRQQRYIIALAEHGSLSQAAKALDISQPALSTWLNHIEDELGIPLVIRSHKRLILTPAGSYYLKAAEEMVRLSETCHREISGLLPEPQEVIRIGGTPNGGARFFARLYPYMHERYPQVKLQFVECYNEDMMDMIAKDKLDIGLGSSVGLSRKDIVYEQHGSREIVLYIPKGMPGYYDAGSLKADAPLPVIDFALIRDIPMIMPSDEMSYSRAIKERFAEAGYEPKVIFRSANVAVIRQMLLSGNGAAALPRNEMTPLDAVSPYSFAPVIISTAVTVYKKNKTLSEAERAYINYQKMLERR